MIAMLELITGVKKNGQLLKGYVKLVGDSYKGNKWALVISHHFIQRVCKLLHSSSEQCVIL